MNALLIARTNFSFTFNGESFRPQKCPWQQLSFGQGACHNQGYTIYTVCHSIVTDDTYTGCGARWEDASKRGQGRQNGKRLASGARKRRQFRAQAQVAVNQPRRGHNRRLGQSQRRLRISGDLPRNQASPSHSPRRKTGPQLFPAQFPNNKGGDAFSHARKPFVYAVPVCSCGRAVLRGPQPHPKKEPFAFPACRPPPPSAHTV